MHDTTNVVLLVNTIHMSNRINTLIQAENGLIHEAQEPLKFLSLIKELQDNIHLAIIDLDIGIEEGFAILKKIKMRNPQLPIIIVSSNNKKDIFLKSIMAGVADYILKPFEDHFFSERVKRFMQPKSEQFDEGPQIISKSLDEYVKAEISKANKGKYAFSVSMTTFFKPVDEISLKQENEYKYLSDDLYKNLSELFWVTDTYIKYGNQSFIGIFPFCEQNNTSIIHNKITKRFAELQNADSKLEGYHIANAFVTYPSEGNDFEEMMSKLTTRLKETIVGMKSTNNLTQKVI